MGLRNPLPLVIFRKIILRRLTPLPRARYEDLKKSIHRFSLGITRPAIRRIARRSGITRVSHSLYPLVKAHLRDYLNDLIRLTVQYTEYARRKTTYVDDVRLALARLGR